MTPRQAEALRLQAEGLTRRQVAERMGIGMTAVKSLLERGRKAGPGVAEALERLGVDESHVRGGWLKDKGASIRFDLPRPQHDPEAIIAAIREGLAVEPPAPVIAPDAPADLCAVFPVADLHVGLLTCLEEVGEDWDTRRAQAVFAETFGKLIAVTPSAGTAILAQLGDLTHVDDFTNATPANRHALDADSRYFVILKRAVAAMKMAIDALRAKYPRVIYASVPGNHDISTAHAVTIALQEAYRGADGVHIAETFAPHYLHEWGANMLVLTHGDKAPLERMVHFVAAQWPDTWGRTRHRMVLSGHVHHQQRKEVGGMICESFGTIIPRDSYAYGHAYTAQRQLVSITLDRDSGEISRARVAA